MQWFTDAAAPALYAAAPANDAALAAREALNRGLSGAFTQLQPVGPIWLQGVGVGVSFDPTFQPSYALSVTQPLLRTVDRDASIDLHGQVLHDTTGRTDGHLGLRYHGRVHGRQVTLGLQGAIDNDWLQDVERYTLGAELRLGQLGVRASGFDDARSVPPPGRSPSEGSTVTRSRSMPAFRTCPGLRSRLIGSGRWRRMAKARQLATA